MRYLRLAAFCVWILSISGVRGGFVEDIAGNSAGHSETFGLDRKNRSSSCEECKAQLSLKTLDVSRVCQGLGFCPSIEENSASTSGTKMKESLLGEVSENNHEETPKNLQRADAEPLTFVQISDIHLDAKYTEGASTDCFGIICCRTTVSKRGSAGKFGDYHCDLPEVTTRALLDYIKDLSPTPEFFVYVGDSSPHEAYETLETRLKQNLMVNTLLVDKLRFSGPIFPAIGNHETSPTNLYRRSGRRTEAVLRALSEQWPVMFEVPKDQEVNIRKHAFYTTVIKPGLRILATNSLYDYIYNPARRTALRDPMRKEQEEFVRKTLKDAKVNKEKVIYMSHMKPKSGQTCTRYSDFINEIATDYQDVLILQLYGHEHVDSFLLNRDPKDKGRITGVSLAAPSITSFQDLRIGVNPSFRVYKLDPDTFIPIDYDQYYIDLPEANARGVAEVKKQYTFTEEYGVPDLSPKSFQDISEKIQKSWPDFQKFEANYNARNKETETCEQADMMCRRSLTCHTRESKSLHYRKCQFGF